MSIIKSIIWLKKNILNIILFSLFICILTIGIIYIKKINYLSYLQKSYNQRQERQEYKNNLLKKEIIIYSKIFNYRKQINLNLYKDYFVIKGDYCNIEDSFFIGVNKQLKEKDIIYKPQIKNIFSNKIEYLKLGKKLNINNLKKKICNYVLSQNHNVEYINIDLLNYKYSKDIESDLHNYIEIGSYKIKKYSKTPKESVINSEIIIDKISKKLIFPGENISILEILLNKGGRDLLESNILEKGKIVKGLGGGSCLASSIIYRALLNSGIEVKSQKTHNIYYENIYGVKEIGLDSTIYEDEKYYIDLIFKNNYKSPIIFIPKYSKNSIELRLYSLKKEFFSKITSINIENKDSIRWKYEVFDIKDNKISEKILKSKYAKIDDY